MTITCTVTKKSYKVKKQAHVSALPECSIYADAYIFTENGCKTVNIYISKSGIFYAGLPN